MKATKILVTLMLLALLLVTLGCHRNKTVKPGGEEVYRPTWWASQNDEAYVCTYGQATKVSETASLDTAKNNAVFEAAQYVETEVKGMMKTYEEEAGVFDPQLLALSQKVVKSISTARFSGILFGKIETRQIEEYGSLRYKTWVQAKIPRTEIRKTVAANIRNEEALYNQFKASQAFQELDQETE
ncbi:MAG TPA: hypothetical protein PL124_10450 [Candidatus Cloacimonadota bacterium]|nr:hypothetical protein [Candidatus Cloacimonadota bacterium]HPS39822.1 hypothetical protein [Candidatus Cloacimonadota bacterium]